MRRYLRFNAYSTHRLLGSALAAVALAAAAPAAAMPAGPMPLGEAAPAPLAFLTFCARMPAECAPPSHDENKALAAEDMAVDASLTTSDSAPLIVGALAADGSAETSAPAADPEPDAVPPPAAAATGPQPLPYSRELEARLNAVNRRINAAIIPASDLKTQGVADRWDLPLEEGFKSGDCEDYVLEKRRALLAEGVPAEDLSIAIAVTGWGEAHAVLLVSTDRGELVMDSLSPWVAHWAQVRYRWIERQAPGKAFDWVRIG